MKLLLDECAPKRLRNDFPDHEIRTLDEVGLKGLKNGQLLSAAVAQGFEALITVDRRMPFQQNLANLNLALIIMVATPCRYEQLKLLVPKVIGALEAIKPGEFVIIK
jgi:hypothetical protein